MSDQDFTPHIADVCPSERQNFRVALVDYLTLQFPSVDAGDHMTTANNAIALAQKDIITAFVKHKAASNNDRLFFATIAQSDRSEVARKHCK